MTQPDRDAQQQGRNVAQQARNVTQQTRNVEQQDSNAETAEDKVSLVKLITDQTAQLGALTRAMDAMRRARWRYRIALGLALLGLVVGIAAGAFAISDNRSQIHQLACLIVKSVPNDPAVPEIKEFRDRYSCPPFKPRAGAAPRPTPTTATATDTATASRVTVSPTPTRTGPAAATRTSPVASPTPSRRPISTVTLPASTFTTTRPAPPPVLPLPPVVVQPLGLTVCLPLLPCIAL